MAQKPPKANNLGPKRVVFDLALVEQYAGLGMTQHEIAYALGSCPATWFKRIADGESDILDAYKRGKGDHGKKIMAALNRIAVADGNPAALIFLAKAHLGRRENIVLTHQGDAENPIVAQSLSPEQRASRIAELEKKRRDEA